MEFGKKTYVMGILNVTPDSFSDGGAFISPDSIAQRIEEMIAAGADILDVGGESTRPFAEPVSEQEELDRVIPAIRAIRRISDVPVSIDTTKSGVARAALDAGASMVNDISALHSDASMLEVARSYDGPLIIMHMRGQPADMQVDPRYDDVVGEIKSFFRERLEWLAAHGISPERVVIDPGIGFGKTVEHNLAILRNISALKELGRPVLIGHSRKSFLGTLLGLEVERRDPASAVISGICVTRGVAILRVHDVALTAQAVKLGGLLC